VIHVQTYPTMPIAQPVSEPIAQPVVAQVFTPQQPVASVVPVGTAPIVVNDDLPF
jgi:hypothetical protein